MQNQTGETWERWTSHLPKIGVHPQNPLETVERAGEKLLTASDNIQKTLKQTVQTTQAITNHLNNEIQAGINAAIAHWLVQHPIIAWILEHPLLTLILTIFSLVLASGAIKAIFQLIEKLGGQLFSSPLKAVVFLLNRGKKKTEKPTLESSVNGSLSAENLAQIVQKLETIEKTQDKILQQLAALQKISQ